MHLFTTFKPKATITKLSEIDTESENYEKYLALVTQWFTDEWGYIHDKNKPSKEEAIADRKKYLEENKEKLNLVFYDNIMVGAFRFENKPIDQEITGASKRKDGQTNSDSQNEKTWQDKLKTNEIWFIYVDPSARGLGVGRQIIKEIKQLSKDAKFGMVFLETLKPNLNRLYASEGAKLIAEGRLDDNPTDVFMIDLDKEDEDNVNLPKPK